MRSTLMTLEDMFGSNDNISLSQFMNKFGPESFLVLIFILISPNLIPFLSQFGIAEVSSAIVCLLSLQLIIGRDTPWLPKRLAQKEISAKNLTLLSDKVFPLLYRLDVWTSPRLTVLTVEKAYRFYGVMFFVLSLLILMPLPLFNYAPAVVIMLSVMALLSKDGLLLLLGLALFIAILAGLGFALSFLL